MSTNDVILCIYFVIVIGQLIDFGFQIAYSIAATKETPETERSNHIINSQVKCLKAIQVFTFTKLIDFFFNA